MTTTVEELAARLSSPRSVVRAEQLDPATEMAQMTVFRTLPDGRCETWLRESGVSFHAEEFDSEADAVAAAEARLFGTAPQPASARHLSGPPAVSVEELKAAMAELGRDPDSVTRAELRREAPNVEGMTVFERLTDGRMRTYGFERGVEHHPETYPDEAAAVAPLYRRLVERYDGDLVGDVDVERMRIRAEQFRELMRRRTALPGRAV